MFNGKVFSSIHPNSSQGSANTVLASGINLDTTSNLHGHAGLMYRIHEYYPTGLLKNYSCETTISPAGDTYNCYPGNQNKLFSYDGLYRMTGAGRPTSTGSSTPQFAFTYDNNGNITKKYDNTNSADVWNATYTPGTNRLDKYYKGTTAPPSPNYTYYAGGERALDDYWEYIYNSNGRLALMLPTNANSGGKYIFFTYDHLSRRIGKMTFSSELVTSRMSQSTYVYDQFNHLIEEEDFPDLITYAYSLNNWVWHGGKPVIGERISNDSIGRRYFQSVNFHTDRLGRPAVVTDYLGQPIWRAQPDPYGKDLGIHLASTATLPYKEVDISSSPIELNHQQLSGNTGSVGSQIFEPGTYAVQLYFEKLDLEPGYDLFWVELLQASGNVTLHTTTGNYGASGGQGFWGPVMQVTAKDIPTYNFGSPPKAMLNFHLEAYSQSGGMTNPGFKITKYRLWHVSSGDLGEDIKSDNPRNGGSTYANGGPGLIASQVWASPTYQYAGAKMVRACLYNFDVEYGYDYVKVENGSGQAMDILTGQLGNICSVWVPGDTVKVTLWADGSVAKYGFDLVRVEMLKGSEIKARFPGQWYDKDTEVRNTSGTDVLYAGLHYNWHRYYDPNIGRYITPDPLGLAAGMNVYAYALQNPSTFTDPDGRIVSALLLGVAGLIGLGATAYALKDKPSVIKATQVAGNLSAGFADNLTSGFHITNHVFGIPSATELMRRLMGTTKFVRRSSSNYNIGELCAYPWLIFTVAGLYQTPATLYHFTSSGAATQIVSDGFIIGGSGLYGHGVYLTRYNAAWLARMQGAKSAQTVFTISTKGRNIKAKLFPGTFTHPGKLWLDLKK